MVKFIYTGLFFIYTLGLITACGSKSDEQPIDLKDIQPVAEYDSKKTDATSNEKKISFYDTLPQYYRSLLDSFSVKKENVWGITVKSFTDRFEATMVQKLTFKTVSDSISFMQWNFKDSSKTLNAFYNWIDCFGSNCKSIQLYAKTTFQKRPMLLLVREKDLFYIEGDKNIQAEKWIKILSKGKLTDDWKYIIHQNKKAKAQWMEVHLPEEKLIEVIK